MANENIRELAKANGVKFWEIADVLSVSEATVTRKLRHELPEDEKQRILEIIKALGKDR